MLYQLSHVRVTREDTKTRRPPETFDTDRAVVVPVSSTDETRPHRAWSTFDLELRLSQSAFSMASISSGASGSTIGEKRAITSPSRPTRNFSKFQRMSPVWPSPSATGVSSV
jgi:hypothetical protein